MRFLLALLLLLPAGAMAQTATMPALTPESMQMLGQLLQSPAVQSMISSQLGAVAGGQTAAPATTSGMGNLGSLLGGNMGNLAGYASVIQMFTPQEISAMQTFAMSTEGQSIAAKLPAVLQKLQASGAVQAK